MCVIFESDERDYRHAIKAMNAAFAAARRGDWRANVDSYKKAFKLSGGASSGFSCRYHCLSGVSAALLDGSVAPNKDDMTFLEEVHEDEREMAVNRVITAYTKGEPVDLFLYPWSAVDLFGTHSISKGAERRTSWSNRQKSCQTCSP